MLVGDEEEEEGCLLGSVLSLSFCCAQYLSASSHRESLVD